MLFNSSIEDVNEELTKYKQEVDEISKSCGVASLDDIDQTDATMSAQHLKTAINLLPKLTVCTFLVSSCS